MPEFSHEDIKNAILHAGETPEQGPTPLEATTLPTADATELEVPHTPYEGFVGSEPTEQERVGFRAAKDQVHTRHRNRTVVEPTVHTRRSGRRAVVAGGTVAGLLLGAGGAFLAFHGEEDNNAGGGHPTTEVSAPVVPGTSDPTPTETTSTSATPEVLPKPADFELTAKSPKQLPEAVATAYTNYSNEADDATSEIMLRGIFGDNMDNDPQSQELVQVWREHRDGIQSHLKAAKNLGDSPYCNITMVMNEYDTPSSNLNGLWTVTVTLTEDTNFDDLYNNDGYDYTQSVVLSATEDDGIFHLQFMRT
ncbi:hypothetical protein BH09PAT4_BH09PAT4_03330 [soil metagenome]